MKDLSYTSFFGKKVSHKEALRKDLLDGILHILMQEENISEKDFSRIDGAMDRVNRKIDNNLLVETELHLQSGKRMQIFYEIKYDEIFRNTPLNESLSVMTFEKFNNTGKSIGKSTNIKDDIKYVRKIPKELKEVALEHIGDYTEAKKGAIYGLKLHKDLKKKIREGGLPSGFDMGINGEGYFIHTHRGSSKSYETPDKITIKDIKFIDSTS